MTQHADSFDVAVVMRRRANRGPAARWQPWQWELAEVLPQAASFGLEPRLLYQDPQEQRWLHPNRKVELFTDDAEGYYLNLTTAAPCWFVMWRIESAPLLSDEPIAMPQCVSLSYHDAGRWLDAQETVEQIAAPQPVIDWLRVFTDAHHVIEPKRRQRPQSFRSLSDRFGNPVSISTEKQRGGRHG